MNTLDMLQAENRVLLEQIIFLEARLVDLRRKVQLNDCELSKQLNDMANKEQPIHDCTLCLGNCE